ncbi:hypothetical protein BDA96_09G149200 [Sorghum bicolor]|uniref:Uncharacterized protein n=1 Tax=Sorghum bicolor TaxID=4558 RepID=A0A921Q9W7_SORBI|nr:hypothetical protein BDA96_09G149200 [Sorghum bicolor]
MSPRPPADAPSLPPSLPTPATSMPPRERLHATERAIACHRESDCGGFPVSGASLLCLPPLALVVSTATERSTTAMASSESPVATAGHVHAREQRSRCERELLGCSRGNMG